MTEIVQAPSNAERVRDGAVWSAGRSVLLRTAGMITMMLAVRIVSPEEFGVWAVALTAHAVIVNSAELGVSSLLIRRDTDAVALAPSASFIAIVSSAVLAAAMVGLAPVLAAGLGAPSAAPVIRVMSLSVLLVGLVAVPNAFLAREYRQRCIFIANAGSVLVGNAVLIVLATRGAGAMAFAWSLVCGQVVAGMIIVRLAGEWYRPKLELAAAAMLVRFGAPLAAANALNYAYLNLDYAIIGRVSGAAALGTYLLAFSISSWPYSILGASINSVSMPAFSDERGPGLQRRIESTVQTVAVLAFPAAALIAVLAAPLIATIYGARWSGAAATLSILAPYGAFFLITLVLGNALVGVGRSGTLLVLQAVWLGALLPIMVFFVELAGPVGAAIAHLVVLGLLAGPAYLFAIRRSTGVAPLRVLRAIVGPAALSALAGGCAWFVASRAQGSLLRLLLGGGAGAVVYLVVASPLLLARLGARSGSINGLLAPVAGPVLALAERGGLGWLFAAGSEGPKHGAWPIPAVTSGDGSECPAAAEGERLRLSQGR